MTQKYAGQARPRASEHGGARVKFLVVAAILCLIAYSGYVFLPVAYDNYLYKDLMQHNADVAGVAGYPPEWVKEQLEKSGKDYNVPADAVINARREENRVVVTVTFTRPIPFPGFTYNYPFDHTAKSTAFLTVK